MRALMNVLKKLKRPRRIAIGLLCIFIVYILSIGPLTLWVNQAYEGPNSAAFSDEQSHQRLEIYFNVYHPIFWAMLHEEKTQIICNFLKQYTSWWGMGTPLFPMRCFGNIGTEQATQKLLLRTVRVFAWVLIGGVCALQHRKRVVISSLSKRKTS